MRKVHIMPLALSTKAELSTPSYSNSHQQLVYMIARLDI